MKRFVIGIAAGLLAASAAQASCYGSASMRSCADASGNNYTVQRFGGSTYMQGSNPRTGSTWSQQSHSFGGSTNIYGSDSAGRAWNSTITRGAGTVHQYGTDASGRAFSRTCGRAGCY